MNKTELEFYIVELKLKINKQQGTIADLLEVSKIALQTVLRYEISYFTQEALRSAITKAEKP